MKTSLKNEFASFQTLSRLVEPAQFVKCGRFFLELNSEGLYPCSKRESRIYHRHHRLFILRRSRAVNVRVRG